MVRSNYAVSDKPLDFSFLKLTEIVQLKKEMQRSGKRKPIAESEEEDDVKKVSYTFETQLFEAYLVWNNGKRGICLE